MTLSPLLTGDNVRLVAVEPDDIPAITRWYADAHFARLFDAAPAMPKTEKEVADSITENQKSSTAYVFGIRLAAHNELIGILELDGILWTMGTAWLAIGIGDRAQRRRGYGTEALKLALQFAFEELNLRRVQLSVFSYNEPAIRLYKKLGFTQEGAFREFLHRDGQFYDMLYYGILRREWNGG